MSVVGAKKIILVGEPLKQILLLKDALEVNEAKVQCVSCAEALNDLTIFKNIDLVILNQLKDDTQCASVLGKLQNSIKTKFIPVVSCIDNVELKINKVLMQGAADYFTPNENVNSVLEKIKSNFGLPNTHSGVSDVNISGSKVVTSVSGAKVYVIEDDPLLRSLLSSKFDVSKVTYAFSSDGYGIEDKLRKFKPSVILLDIMIGIVNGLDVLESIKQTQDLKNIPIIIFSNQDSDDERQRAAELGASQYLVKATTDLSDLVRLLSAFT